MPFTFVYRSQYDNLIGRYIQRFDDDSILSWFQKHWGTDGDSKKLLGQDVYGFEGLFENISEDRIRSPKTFEQLSTILKEHIYAEVGVNTGPHLIEVFTDDDEIDLQYFFIEDEFAKQNPERTEFLLHDGSLPTKVTGLKSEPGTYLYVHSPEQSADSQTWDRVICPGVRLSDDPVTVIEAYNKLESVEAAEFRSKLAALGAKKLSWFEMMSALVSADDGAERDEISKIITSDHICQLHHHVATWEVFGGPRLLFDQVVVFDDIWANEYQCLAKSIDYYARDKSLLRAYEK